MQHDHPVIGGHNAINRGNINIDNRHGNINIGNRNNTFVNINRPGWNHPGWGFDRAGGYWADHWHDRIIDHHHYPWYHGPWVINRWYVPVVYGFGAWGLAATLPAWGYSYAYPYWNPYYVVPQTTTVQSYDYSQPITINVTGATGETAQPQETPETNDAYRLFDQARDAFRKQDYSQALQLDLQAIGRLPKDPLLHEFGALCSFALGDYPRAAAVLNSLLAAAPGMDWTTMCSLYPDVEVYTGQLRALEARCREQPQDAAANFVLGYHYLVAGHTDAAISRLKAVVAVQPNDRVAQQMLTALTTAEKPAAGDSDVPAPPTGADQADAAPTTDLVGQWRAVRDGDQFELAVDANSQFTWKASQKGKAPITLSGPLTVAGDTVVLNSQSQGTMAARVVSGGPDRFQFMILGGAPGDNGLEFQRVAPGG